MHLLKVGWAFLFASVKSILLGISLPPFLGIPWGYCAFRFIVASSWLLLTEHAIWVANPSCPTTRLSRLPVASPTVTESIPWLPTGLFPVVTVVTEKCWIFVMGCPNLIVVTGHEPLKGLFEIGTSAKSQTPDYSD